MFWHKLQHHFFFFFFSFVLLAQSLIFVASQAVSFKNYDLKSTWQSPAAGQSLVSGQKVEFKVKIENKNKKIGSLYFVLSDPNKNFVLNFESQSLGDVYSGLSTWDTADWPIGVYNISLRANIIDDQGKIIDEQESAPIWVKIISIEEYNNLLSNNKSSNISQSANVVPNSAVTGSDDQTLGDSLSADTKNHATTNTGNNTTSTSTSTPNNNATSTTNLAPDLQLVTPVSNSIISTNSFLLRFLTNFLSDNVSVEFINTDNAAISTGAQIIDKTDGYNWVKTIELADTFINGSYKLLISATIPNSNLVLTKSFDYDLSIPSKIKPEDLLINLVNLQSNVQGQVGLRAEANLSIDNLDFVIEDSINHVEALRIKGINSSVAGASGASFFGVWDTAVLPNGNYLVYVESKIDQQKVGSTKQLVTTYNPNNAEKTTSTPADLENAGGPGIISAPTSTVSVANSLTPNAQSSIDCQRSGITDQNLCLKYQAEINDSLPTLCVDKSIFVSSDCEKYIFENTSNGCLEQKIQDPIKCREYLYKKYSGNLTCNISATSTCQQVLSDKYVARLAYELEQRNKVLAVVDSLSMNGLTLNSLHDKLATANLNDSNLSLVASDKYIDVFTVKNKNNLDTTENLYVSSPALIMGDADSDGLPDDLESYYQTDANKADTDGDGHNDGQEVLNNYNPLGEGKLTQERTALDQALLGKLALEEPRTSTLPADSSWVVSEVSSAGIGMQLSGKALPNTWVNIFVYSGIPFLATIKSDINGNWSYNIADPLTEGVHQIYIANNDKNGKLLARSEPLTFLVANIKNDSAPVGAGQQINVTNQITTENNWTMYYIIGGVFLFLVLLGLVLLFLKKRHQQTDGLGLQTNNLVNTSVSSTPTKVVTQTEDESIKLPDTPIPSVAPEIPPVIVENNNQENRPST